MADSASSSDYKLDDLTVTVKDAADDLGKLAVEKTTFSQLKSDQIFSQPPALAGSDALTIGDTSLEVSASATYQATAFVQPTDADPDGVVTVGTGQAWLKQELALVANLSGDSGSRRLGPASADAEDSTQTNVRLLDYRLHAPTDLVAQAVVDAIKSARFAVRVADVDQLDSGSRLAVVESGALSLTLKLSVADTLSASLAVLDKALGISAPIQIQSSGDSDFTAGLSDDFQIVFSRAASGRIGVNVQKTTNGQLGVTAGYGVTVGLADPQSVTAALDSYITSRLGVSYTDYQKLESTVCSASAFSALPQTEQALAQQVAATLGIGDAEQKFSDLKSKICGLDEKLTNTIQSVVTAQLQDALTFTWSRMSNDQTVLSFEIDQAALPDYLHGLVLGDLSPSLKALASNDPRFTLGSYLETRQDTTGRGFGLSLSLGKWSINSQSAFKIVWQMDTQTLAGAPQQRAALDGRYSYTSTWLKGQTETYYLDLGATMSGFSTSPTVADFQFGLHLSWTWQEKPSSSLAARWADLAELWGCQTALAGAVPTTGTDDAAAAVDLVLSHDGVMAIVQAANQQDPRWTASWGWALATALPPISELSLRGSVAGRQQTYLQSAQDLLETQGQAVEVVTGLSYTAQEEPQLEPIDLAGLGRPLTGIAVTFEMFGLRTLWRPDSATSNPAKIFEATRRAFAALAQTGNYRAQIEGLIRQLDSVVSGDPFSTRLLGAALVRYLTQTGQSKLFTTSASYKAGTSTTIAAAGGS